MKKKGEIIISRSEKIIEANLKNLLQEEKIIKNPFYNNLKQKYSEVLNNLIGFSNSIEESWAQKQKETEKYNRNLIKEAEVFSKIIKKLETVPLQKIAICVNGRKDLSFAFTSEYYTRSAIEAFNKHLQHIVSNKIEGGKMFYAKPKKASWETSCFQSYVFYMYRHLFNDSGKYIFDKKPLTNQQLNLIARIWDCVGKEYDRNYYRKILSPYLIGASLG